MDHSKINYIPINKNFYKESPLIARMSDEEIAKLQSKAASPNTSVALTN